MKLCTIIGGIIVLGLVSTTAFAQTTLGDLLDAGGKKLSKEGLQAALSGARVSGKTATGAATVESDFKADGTYSGTATSTQGASGYVGTWSVDDSGKLCVEFTRTRGGRDKQCGYYFAIADRYYVSESDSERGSPLIERTIKK